MNFCTCQIAVIAVDAYFFPLLLCAGIINDQHCRVIKRRITNLRYTLGDCYACKVCAVVERFVTYTCYCIRYYYTADVTAIPERAATYFGNGCSVYCRRQNNRAAHRSAAIRYGSLTVTYSVGQLIDYSGGWELRCLRLNYQG